MPKKERANMKRSKSKRIGKKQKSALQEKRLKAASAIQVEKDMPSNKLEEAAAVVKREEESQSNHSEQSASKHKEQRAASKPANHSEVTYRKLYDACAKSKHLAGKLIQQRSGLLLNLPTSLPGALIIRALKKEEDRYKVLHTHRIATREDQLAQLELLVDGMKDDQLTTLIEELDELIGDFTGRS